MNDSKTESEKKKKKQKKIIKNRISASWVLNLKQLLFIPPQMPRMCKNHCLSSLFHVLYLNGENSKGSSSLQCPH